MERRKETFKLRGKHLISFILAISMLTSVLPIGVFAEETECEKKIADDIVVVEQVEKDLENEKKLKSLEGFDLGEPLLLYEFEAKRENYKAKKSINLLSTTKQDDNVETTAHIVYCSDKEAVIVFSVPDGMGTPSEVKISDGTASYTAVQNRTFQVYIKDLEPETYYGITPVFNDGTGNTFGFTTKKEIIGIQSEWQLDDYYWYDYPLPTTQLGNRLTLNGKNGEQTTYDNQGWHFATDNYNLTYNVIPYNVSENIAEIAIIVRNNTEFESSATKFGFWTDVQIKDNDYAPIYNKNVGFLMTDGYYTLMLANTGSGLVNGRKFIFSKFGTEFSPAVITKWWGYWANSQYNVYTDSSPYSTLTGTDSGAACSWQNIVLLPGETRLYTMKFATGVSDEQDIEDWINDADTLALTIYDEAGTDVSDYCSINWYDNVQEEVLFSGKHLRHAEPNKQYYYEILLDDDFGAIYKEPEKQCVEVLKDGYDVTYTLSKLPIVNLNGKIKDSNGNPIKGAKIEAEQTVNSRHLKKSDVLSGENGQYQLSVVPGNITIAISKPGYKTEKFELNNVTDIEQIIEEKTLSKLPLTNLKIISPPQQTTYFENDELLLNGIKVVAIYEDAFEEDITDKISVDIKGKLTKDIDKVAISYTENGITKTAEQKITVKIKPPAEFSVTAPKNNSENLDISSKAEWQASERAEYYDVFLWEDGKVRPSVPSYKKITKTEVSMKLDYGKKYHLVVDAVNESGTTSSAETVFSTLKGPDLAITNINAPTEVYADSPITVSWKVENVGGLTTGSAQWNDTVYIMSSETFDSSNILVAEQYGNISYLDKGESYSNEATINIPRGTSGTYYVYVVTANDTSLKDSNSNNNTIRSNAVNVILPPTPDLAITDIKCTPVIDDVPGAYSSNTDIISGNKLSVKWSVENTGIQVEETNSWRDLIVLSNEDGTKTYNISMVKIDDDLTSNNIHHQNGKYTAEKIITIPEEIYGNWKIYVYADYYDELYENITGNNNASSNLSVTLNPPADIVPEDIMIPDNITSGNEFSITWTDKNNGAKSVSGKSWTDKIYISSESNFDESNSTVIATLNNVKDAKENTAEITLPVNYKGEYYIYIVSDYNHSIFEFETYDNNIVSKKVNITQGDLADLIVESVTVEGTAFAGESVTVKYTVVNNGAGKTSQASWNDGIYLVDSDGRETKLADISHSGYLKSSEKYNVSKAVTIPASADVGDYTFVVKTNINDRVLEAYNTNNDKASEVVYVNEKRDVELELTNMSIVCDNYDVNQPLEITYTVKNNGTYPASGYNDAIVLSTSEDKIESPVVLAKKTHSDKLESQAEYTDTISAILPGSLSSGKYYIFIVANYDKKNWEADYNNNFKSSYSINPEYVFERKASDLCVTEIVVDENASSGKEISVSYTVKNIADTVTCASSWTDNVYLVNTDTPTLSGITPAASNTIKEAVNADGEYTKTLNIKIPNGVSGTYYVYVVADANNSNKENVTDNNKKASDGIDVQLSPCADLKAEILEIPDTVVAGQPFEVKYKITNIGDVKTDNTWNDSLNYRSLVGFSSFNANAATMANVQELEQGESYIATQTITISSSFIGNCVVKLESNKALRVYEQNKSNNEAEKTINVLPLPNNELTVHNVNAPASAMPGENITVSWDVINLSTAPLDAYVTDNIYISADNKWDSSDVLVTQHERQLQLEPSASDYSTVSFDMLDYETLSKITETATDKTPGIKEGRYYIIVRTDAKNQISEPNEDNNAESSRVFSVSVKNVKVGNSVSGSLEAYGEKYYKFTTPAEKALNIMLNELTDGANTEVYVKANAIPSAADYDYKYSSVSEDNTGITIPYSQSGSYYIYLRNTDGSVITDYSFDISELNFGVNYVSPSVGGQGKVTLKLSGALLDSNAEVTLVGQGVSANAENVYYIDSSNAYATFDMTYAPYGIYDLEIKCGGLVSTVNGAFEVKNLPAGELDIKVNLDSTIVNGSIYSGTITYVNKGYTDVYAPILYVESENASFKPSDSSEFVNNATFFAKNQNGLDGILAYGEGGTYNFAYKSDSIGNYKINVYDYSNIEELNKEIELDENSTPDEILTYNIQKLIGNSGKEYSENIALMASHLEQFGNNSFAPDHIAGGYIANANGTLIGEYVSSSTDISSQKLSLSRSFTNNISFKNNKGILGKGWANGYDISAEYVSADDYEYIVMTSGSDALILVKDENGQFVDAAYGLATATINGDKITVNNSDGSRYKFNNDGYLAEVTDSNGNSAKLSYSGKKLSEIESDGDTITLEYDGDKVIKASTATDFVTYTYNGDYLASVTGNLGTVSYEYDTTSIGGKRGSLTKTTYPNGVSEFIEYDDLGRISAIYNNDGANKTSYFYDGINKVTVIDNAGNAATYYYNEYGNVVRCIDSEGNTQNVSYNDYYLADRISFGINSNIKYEYDDKLNVKSVTSPDGYKTSYTYDGFGNITSVTDKRGITTKYERDEKGNNTKIVYDDSTFESYTYDAKGNVASYTDRMGNTANYEYDGLSRLTKAAYADGGYIAYEYDDRGNVTKADENGDVTLLSYDEKGQLVKITYPNNKSVNYSYDELGRTTAVTDDDGDGSRYTYDSLGRLSTVSDKDKVQATYTYNTDSTLKKVTNANGTSTNYSYANGKVKSIYNYGADGGVMSSFAYTYDTLGNIASMKTNEGVWKYEYDANSQLIKSVDPTGKTTEYAYDLSGNKTSVKENGVTKKYTANRLNQVTKADKCRFTYDLNGNMTSMTDENGKTVIYGYDNRNRLVSVTDENGSSYSYGYDAFGLRNSVTKDGETTEYLNTPGGYGYALASFTGGEKTQYILGNGLVSQIKDGKGYYYSFNHLGSTQEITDRLGNTVNSYAYDQDGIVTSKTEGIANPYTYVGQYGIADDNNGLYYMRARYVSQDLGRFINVDPLGQNYDLNVYRYAGNNTIFSIDATGQYTITTTNTISKFSSFATNPITASSMSGASVGEGAGAWKCQYLCSRNLPKIF